MAKDIEIGTEYAPKDYQDPPPAPLIDPEELGKWSFYRAIIAEFIATLLFSISLYSLYGGGTSYLNDGYSTGTGLGAEIIGTFVLVYTVFAATDPKRNARDSHVPVGTLHWICGFHGSLCWHPVTGTGINPARSFGAAVIYGKDKAWDDQWIFLGWTIYWAAIAAFTISSF
ncbi:hypothetical protein HAX54_039602 [Datura stramonium]|uniref:Uncharacterized protein n=1 Tax=Datura stramonium TaxID=4076 RepID=A0ABS8VQX5_DATST|nr:hypothetical protein [Datura stramonium]